MIEIWRPVVGFEKFYEVSNYGRIKNKHFHNGNSEKIMKLDSSSKYLRIEIKQKAYLVHNLVAKAFPEICGKWFEGCDVHHINGNKYDNRAVNLLILTKEDHQKIHSNLILKPIQQFSIKGELISVFESASEAARKTGINRSNIVACLKCRRNIAGGYVWKYKEVA